MSKTQVAAAVVSALTCTTRIAAADDQASPPPRYQPAPAPAPSQLPGGAPAGAPPGYGPPGYTRPPSGVPIDAPEEITDFDNNAPVPYGYTKVTRARTGLIIGGAATLGATYAVTVFTGVVGAFFEDVLGSKRKTDIDPLIIPVIGPFVEIGNADSARERLSWTVLGLGQTAGAILVVYGLTSPRTALVRNDQLIVTSIAPLVAPGASGLSVVGRF